MTRKTFLPKKCGLFFYVYRFLQKNLAGYL